MSTNNTSGNSGQGFTHRHPGWWRVLTLGFVIGGGLATAIFVTACPTDKWDEPDDDLAMRTSPVPGSPIDDLVDPSAATCQDGWRPLGLIEGVGGYTDMSVSADGVLALSAPGVVELWDVRAARKPAGLGTIKATELGAYGGFGDLAATSQGFAAIAARGDADAREHIIAAIVPTSGRNGVGGPNDESAPPAGGFPSLWKLGDVISVGARISQIDASGDDFVVAGPEGVVFGKHEPRGLGITARNAYGHDMPIHPNAVALDVDQGRAIVTSSNLGISLLTMRPSGAVDEITTIANPQMPLLVRTGWLIPETNQPSMWSPRPFPKGTTPAAPGPHDGNPEDLTNPGPPSPQGGPGDLTSPKPPSMGGPTDFTGTARPSPHDGPEDLTNPQPPSLDGPSDLMGSKPAPSRPSGPDDFTGEKPDGDTDQRSVDDPGLPVHSGQQVEGGYLELLDTETGRLRKLASVPAISAFDAEDGAFQAVRKGDTLYIANSESGVLRAEWTGETLSVDTRRALTLDTWADMPTRPQKIALHGDTLFIIEPYSDVVGVVQICE